MTPILYNEYISDRYMTTNRPHELEKRKITYENKINDIIKHLLKSRIGHYKAQLKYNTTPTKANKRKLDDTRLDLDEDK